MLGQEQPATTTNQATASSTTAAPPTTETAPPKPPRPLNPQQEAQNTLKEAFPDIDATVIHAVLVASGGRIEPAFNALLGMSDPEHAAELQQQEQAPRQPPPLTGGSGGAPMSQLEADELYARQLAQHYDASSSVNRSRSAGDGRHPQNGQHIRPRHAENDDYNFIDDELPAIKENLRKGFLETQSKVNGWITNLKKRIDGDDIGDIRQEQESHAQGGYQPVPGQGSYRPSGDANRRSNDAGRYDADPQMLSDDFAGINMNDESSELFHSYTSRLLPLSNKAIAGNQPRSSRPLANPDLFKPQPAPPRGSSDSRSGVRFQEQSQEDLYAVPPARQKSASPGVGGKPSKWQPLSSVDPKNPTTETDNDPFSLGDSDDEREAKEKSTTKDSAKDTVSAAPGSSSDAPLGDSAATTDKTAGTKLA